MRRTTIALCTALLIGATGWVTGVNAADASRPGPIGEFAGRPGPGAGQITFNWRHSGAAATRFEIETGLTLFSPSPTSSLPRHARGSTVFTAPGSARSLTLTAAQVAAAGAPLGSGNHLYFRLKAVNGAGERWFPKLRTSSMQPRSTSATAAAGGTLRLASFNVRTVHATGDPRTWLQRLPDVVQEITAKNPGLVMLQELTPGRADGRGGSTKGTARQTDSLATAFKAVAGGKYRLVRTTPYVPAGTPTGTQGTRLLYDSSRLTLLSDCPDKTGTRSYSTSCAIPLPALPSDQGRKAVTAYAKFQVRSTGRQFFAVSAHLNSSHSTNVATEKTFDALRTAQMKTILNTMDRLNPGKLPVVLGGDLNTWQNNKVGFGAHDALIAAGFYDTAAATTRMNLSTPPSTHFATVVKPTSPGFGSRLDVIAVKGISSAIRFENVLKPVDATRPSDHNMVVADIPMFR